MSPCQTSPQREKKGNIFTFFLAVLWTQIICGPCRTWGRLFDCFRFHLFLSNHDSYGIHVRNCVFWKKLNQGQNFCIDNFMVWPLNQSHGWLLPYHFVDILFSQNVWLNFNQWYLHNVPWELVTQWQWSLFHCPTSYRILKYVYQRCHSEAGMRDI